MIFLVHEVDFKFNRLKVFKVMKEEILDFKIKKK